VDNKRVLVDVERGRTVPNWRPRRLGGGLGSSRMGGADADKKDSARYICFLILITCKKLLLLEGGTGVNLSLMLICVCFASTCFCSFCL